MSGWEIPRVLWRLGKSSRVLMGPKTSSQRELQKMMVKAGGRDGTADEALVAFYGYVARQENWGPHSIAEHQLLGSFGGNIEVAEELNRLGQKVGAG